MSNRLLSPEPWRVPAEAGDPPRRPAGRWLAALLALFAAAWLVWPAAAPVHLAPVHPLHGGTPLYYEGVWNGPQDYRGRILIEKDGARAWHDVQALLDGRWNGQPATAILGVTQLSGFGAEGRVVVPGSQTWTASGSHVVSEFNRLEVAVWGGGGRGGGGGSGQSDGSAGNASTYASATSVVGNGGGGGERRSASGDGGSGGTATGGDTNTTGGNGGTSGSGLGNSGDGGNAASGTGTLLGTLTGGTGAAHPVTNLQNGAAGNAPGGGGSGAANEGGGVSGGGGGAGGGLAIKLWNFGDAGAPATAASITTTVGGAQSGGGAGSHTGGNGARGEIRAQWD